jgi:hypothetical protein
MKKLMVAAAALAFGAVASAGEYHVGKYLLCYDCHSMHGSQSHGFGNAAALGAAGPASAQLGGDWQFAQNTVFQYLLKGAESESCMACHDGKNFAPDVVGDNFNGYPRSGGSIADGSAGHETYKGHTVDAGSVTPPGGTAAMTTGLRCYDCHIQHGMATSYRNLGSRADALTQPTFAIQDQSITATDLTKDVTIRIATAAIDPTAVGTVHYLPQIDGVFGGYYDMRNVSYAQQTVGTISYANRMNNLCALCHANFHGAPGAGAVGNGATTGGVGGDNTATDMTGWEAFTRHPTSGVQVGGLVPIAPNTSNHGHTSATGLNGKTTKVKAAQKNASDFVNASPMCISCHNAHGSTNGFGLRFIAGNVALTAAADIENGTGRYANLCNQCHGQGTSNIETYTGPLSGVVK